MEMEQLGRMKVWGCRDAKRGASLCVCMHTHTNAPMLIWLLAFAQQI